MRVILKPALLALAADTADEAEQLAQWRSAASDHVFHLDRNGAMHDLGPRALACREPINVLFDSRDEPWKLISNLANTPFEMDGLAYASVEGFWQGLKFADSSDRARVAQLWGAQAKNAWSGPTPAQFVYEEELIASGGPAHRALMARACRNKFDQHAPARDALLATGDRVLVHRARRDSVNLPGALLADIWMRIRNRLRRGNMADGRVQGAG